MKYLALIPLAFLCIFASPFILWSAESQNRAKDFESAKEVQLDSSEEGYILIEGEADLEDSLNCPHDDEKQCIYVSKNFQRFEVSEQKVCTSQKPKERITKELPSTCDENGANCTPCYMVEKEEWKSIDTSSQFSKFTIGNYEVVTRTDAKLVGTEEYIEYLENEYRLEEVDEYSEYFDEIDSQNTDSLRGERQSEKKYKSGDERNVYSYLENTDQIIVAGESRRNGEISGGDETFVISNLSYSETLDNLESQDSSAKWGLRIVSLLAMVIGFTTIASAIVFIPLSVVKVLPLVGEKLSGAVGSGITMVSAIVAVLAWLAIFVVVMILKNILALIVAFTLTAAVIGGLILFVVKMRNKKTTQSKA